MKWEKSCPVFLPRLPGETDEVKKIRQAEQDAKHKKIAFAFLQKCKGENLTIEETVGLLNRIGGYVSINAKSAYMQGALKDMQLD